MSRTYKKNIRCFICYGDNREFYYHRRRKRKNAHRMQLRSLVAHYDANEIDDVWKEPNLPVEDQWAEPTDGHWVINKTRIKKMENKYGYVVGNVMAYYHNKFDRYLKPKRGRHKNYKNII